VGVCQLSLHYADLYERARIQHAGEFLRRLVLAMAATASVLAGLYAWFPRWAIGPGVFLAAAAIVVWLVPSWRLAFVWLASRLAPRERLLIVGTNAAAVALARELDDRRQELGVEVAGFADASV